MTYIYGRHPVLEALRSGRRVSRVLVAAGMRESEPLTSILTLAQQSGIPVEVVDRQVLDAHTQGGVHQGVVAFTAPFAYAGLDDVLKRVREESLLVLALDAVQDPQNLGTLLRTAEATGVHGVLLPKHRAAGVTPAVEKAAAGAAQLVAIVQVSNLVHALKEMKRSGAWVVGVENDAAAKRYDQVDLTVPLVLVLGSEGRGLGRLVRETCDFLVRLPMRGRISSLNVAIAGAVVLYEVVRQRTAR